MNPPQRGTQKYKLNKGVLQANQQRRKPSQDHNLYPKASMNFCQHCLEPGLKVIDNILVQPESLH